MIKLKAMIALLAVVGITACSSTTEIQFKDKKTGKVLDTVWERKDATNPMAPSTAALFNYDDKAGKVVTEAYVAGATPVEQVMPLAAAGVTANGMIRAAKATAPDVTNINNSNSNSATAEATNFTAIWQEWNIEQRVDFDNCKPVDGWRKKGCGY
jgi:hypothetical protein